MGCGGSKDSTATNNQASSSKTEEKPADKPAEKPAEAAGTKIRIAIRKHINE